MAVKIIRLAGDPVLRKVCAPIRNYPAAKRLVGDLRDTLMNFRRTHGLGRGIAAPQIGSLERAVYVITDEFAGELLNPKIIKHGENEFVCWDACFSFKAAFFAKVRRWKEIEVEYFDADGNRKTLKAKNALSELLQHELDHLDGILFVDRIVKEGNGDYFVMREEWEKKGNPFKA